MPISNISLQKRKPLYIGLALSYLFIFNACSSVPTPKTPIQKRSLSSSSTVDKDALMGPPSLLALTEGTVDSNSSSDEDARAKPRLNLLKKNRKTTVIQLWLKAGVVHETSSEYGSTFILDHLLTKNLSKTGLPQAISKLGGRVRSWISLDRYVLSIEIAKNHTYTALELMGTALSALPNTNIIEPVLSQVQQTPTDNSWLKRRMTSRLVTENINRLPNNLSQPINPSIIETEALKNLEPKAVENFLKRIIHPRSSHLIIVGDVDETAVQSSITNHLSSPPLINTKHKTPDKIKSRPPKDRDLSPLIDIEPISSQVTLIQVAFPIGTLTPEEAGYLDLLSFILIGDQNGSLHRKALRAGVDLKSASTAPVITDKGSVFVVSIEVASTQIDDGWQILLETLSSLIHQPISQRHLERAKSIFERETLLIGESLIGQARRLGFFSSHWPTIEALTRYGRTAYRARPSSLFKFTQTRLVRSSPHALIAGQQPVGSNLNIWRERMTEQLKQVMTQRTSKNLVGFSKHGSKFNLLFTPLESDGVTSLTATLPLDISSKRSTLTSLKSLALGHWFAALISERFPNEPHFNAQFHDDGLTLSITFPSHLIGEIFNALMRKLRQAPLRSETQWSAEHIERARKHALNNLSRMDQDANEKLRFLNQRATHAFSRWQYPLPKSRIEKLSKLSSSELTRWFSQHIQTLSMYVVVSGDVKESSLSRALSPLSLPNQQLPNIDKVLHSSPVPSLQIKPLKRCRKIKLISNNDEAWASLSFPVPQQVTPETLKVLESALVYKLPAQNAPNSYRRIVLDNYTKPSMLTIYLYASAKRFNQNWKTLLDDIEHLKLAKYAPNALDKIKQYVLRVETEQFERSRKHTDWLSRAWFSGWHTSGNPLTLSTWAKRINSVSNEHILKAAQAIFIDKQARFSLIIPPYLQVSPTLKCQVIVP